MAKDWAVGEWAYCTVHGPAEGWYKVKAVRARDGYIQINWEGVWCPHYNFSRVDRHGRRFEEVQ